MSVKQEKRTRIHTRIRAKIMGTAKRPRLSVFKSGKHMYAQLIDDDSAKVLVAVSDMKMSRSKKDMGSRTPDSVGASGRKVNHALEIGKLVAKEALAKKIETVVFDRGGFVFHGRIKAVADGAREGGLKF